MGALAWDCSSAACASTGFICPAARLGDSMKEADRRAGSRGRRPLPRCNISCSSAETARAETLEAQGGTALSCMALHAPFSHVTHDVTFHAMSVKVHPK